MFMNNFDKNFQYNLRDQVTGSIEYTFINFYIFYINVSTI